MIGLTRHRQRQALRGIGNDGLNGGDGDDSLYGEDGSDWLSGGAGADWLDAALQRYAPGRRWNRRT